jgi:hypothetical protein
MKRLGALEHRNDGMEVSSSGYSTSNFTGSAKSLLGKQGRAEDVYAVVLQRLSDKAKTGLCESQSPGVEPHTRR